MPPTPTSNSIRLTPTGGDDTAAIQMAIDAVSFPTTDWRMGLLELDGAFRVSTSLRIGAEGALKAVCLQGVGQAFIKWTASTTDDYLIRCFGEGRSFAPRISNLALDCNRKCRGILVQHQAYAGGIHNIGIHNARQVGLDLVDCWGTECSHLVFSAVDGIAIRGVGWNSSVLRLTKIGGKGETWPDPLDESVKRHDGSFVQTAVDQRAAVVLRGGISEVSDVCFEVCKYPNVPLLRFPDPHGFAHEVRNEGCECAEDWALIGGVQQNIVKA